MSNTGADTSVTETVTEAKAEQPKVEVTTTGDKTPKDKARMAKALAALQKERDDAKAALAKAQEDAKRASMTELDKLKADLDAKAREAEAARIEAAQAKAERERERLVSRLVAKHKLAEPEFGDLILKGYNPEEHEDFDAFVATVKADAKYKRLFALDNRITNEDGSDIVPATGPAPKSKTSNGSSQDADDREFAESMFPNNKARQDAYIAQLRKLRSGK